MDRRQGHQSQPGAAADGHHLGEPGATRRDRGGGWLDVEGWRLGVDTDWVHFQSRWVSGGEGILSLGEAWIAHSAGSLFGQRAHSCEDGNQLLVKDGPAVKKGCGKGSLWTYLKYAKLVIHKRTTHEKGMRSRSGAIRMRSLVDASSAFASKAPTRTRATKRHTMRHSIGAT